jgi:hypothetical protein
VNNDGRQAFGVCCTNPITPTPAIDESKKTTTQKPNKITPISSSGSNQYPNWPPPVPTHPPNHTPATHPPIYFGVPGAPPTTSSPSSTTNKITTTKFTTKRSTTWPTKKPATNKPQQTTQWPPLIPTHPATQIHPLLTSTTRRPVPIITTPSNEISNEVSFAGSCGIKNGNPVNQVLKFKFKLIFQLMLPL